MSTLIILVLGVTLLIFGVVLVRGVMCKSLELTDETGKKAKAELDKYFEESGSEVICLGSGTVAVTLAPGRTNFVFCSIKSPEAATYSVTVKDYNSFINTLSKTDLEKWIAGSKTWSGSVAPGDYQPKKVFVLGIPKDAPEGAVRFSVEIKKNNGAPTTQDLDFQISRVGFIKTTMC
jgi:hypothetical protein